MGHYAGLDVHSKACVFEVQDAQGKIIARGSVATTPEGLATLRAHCPASTPVALESSTVAFFVARQLAALGFMPAVIDAREVRLKAHRPRQKSDRRDAHELCEGLRRDIYRTRIHVPPPAVAELRETLSRRRHFVRLQAAEINAAKRLLRTAGLGQLTRDLGSNTGWLRLRATLRPRAPCRSTWRSIMPRGGVRGSKSRPWRRRSTSNSGHSRMMCAASKRSPASDRSSR